jgi:hypothetical protein
MSEDETHSHLFAYQQHIVLAVDKIAGKVCSEIKIYYVDHLNQKCQEKNRNLPLRLRQIVNTPTFGRAKLISYNA